MYPILDYYNNFDRIAFNSPMYYDSPMAYDDFVENDPPPVPFLSMDSGNTNPPPKPKKKKTKKKPRNYLPETWLWNLVPILLVYFINIFILSNRCSAACSFTYSYNLIFLYEMHACMS